MSHSCHLFVLLDILLEFTVTVFDDELFWNFILFFASFIFIGLSAWEFFNRMVSGSVNIIKEDLEDLGFEEEVEEQRKVEEAEAEEARA